MEFSLYDFFLAFLNFALILGVLYKFFYPKILETLDARQNQIREDFARAEEARKEAEELLARYQSQITTAQEKAEAIVVEAKKAGEEVRMETIRRAEEQAEALVKKAQSDIRDEKEKALAEVRGEVAALAVMAAGKVLNKTITVKDHERMINEFLVGVGEQQ